MTSIIIAGGYGVVGSSLARLIRSVNRDIEIVLAGRNPERGATLAQKLGNARTLYLDLEKLSNSENWGRFDLIVSALQDPADALIDIALKQGIAHIGITKLSDEITPLSFLTLGTPPKRPIVPLGHSQSGVMTLVALKAAEAFSQVDSIELAGLYDDHEQMGPMTVGDAEGFMHKALMRENGKWIWAEAANRKKHIRLTDGSQLEGFPMGLLDVPSLAAATGAPNVRFDFIKGESIGTKAGKHPSQDLYIDIAGLLNSGESVKRRTVVSDPYGQAHLTGLGMLVAVERILALDGMPAVVGGVYLPETLVSVDTAIARFERFGVRIFSEDI
ncbi:saccharopine dehydrogenase family protein [Paenibacillus jiagnxiensis]|uniref:hypothetical protein n=1 Tax=Paenibacillus jiagnxiensis TaxID=3228926 RepID=UPI0033BED5AF